MSADVSHRQLLRDVLAGVKRDTPTLILVFEGSHINYVSRHISRIESWISTNAYPELTSIVFAKCKADASYPYLILHCGTMVSHRRLVSLYERSSSRFGIGSYHSEVLEYSGHFDNWLRHLGTLGRGNADYQEKVTSEFNKLSNCKRLNAIIDSTRYWKLILS